VRRSLKEDKRIAAEKRGESELRFAKWEVSEQMERYNYGQKLMQKQNGKQGEVKNLNEALAATVGEIASST
jgi:F-type H+-transporting ATPase subunit epsilon